MWKSYQKLRGRPIYPLVKNLQFNKFSESFRNFLDDPGAELHRKVIRVERSYDTKRLRYTEQNIIERILKQGNYDWRVRPKGLNDSWPGEKNRLSKKSIIEIQTLVVPLLSQ